ncbi:MAG: hypothetical protein WC714_18400 [Candidatus Obscuribacterales bacterium]|jgi:hypothetical protein
MNSIHASLFASYAPAIFSGEGETKQIDSLVQSIQNDWLKVTELAASAKKALFAVKSHRGTYEVALKQKESIRRRAILNKQSALVCSYTAAVYAFRFFGQRLVASTRVLAGLIPDLIKDSGISAGNSMVNDCRRSNTVVCTRIISDMPDTLTALAAELSPEDIMLIASGSGDLISLSLELFEHEKAHRFAAPLNVPYQFGAICHPAYQALEEELVKLEVVVARAEQTSLAFERARSLALNQEQFQSRLANVSTPEKARLIIKEADATMVDYRASLVALEIGLYAVYAAERATEEKLKALPNSFGNSENGQWGLAQTNRIAAKCLLESVVARCKKIRPGHRNSENHQLRDTSYATMENAFKSIPATFQFPFLGFLQSR